MRDVNRTLPLFTLPTEILNHIIKHIPADAEASLSLTCKEALHRIGTASWAFFRGRARHRRDQYGSLVELLQRDIPEYEYCARCETPSAHCLGQEASIDYWPQTEEGGYTQPVCMGEGPPLRLFNGNFTFRRKDVDYTLRSSGRWVDRNLIVTHEHRLRMSDSKSWPLRAVDITSLPFRVCAHLTTTTAPPVQGILSSTGALNGPLLTHAIASAFPKGLQKGLPKPSTFRKATAAEQDQIAAAESESTFVWRCRSCPTKVAVCYDGDEVVVKAWHCFGKELYKAVQFWSLFVRREGPTMGSAKRNSEYRCVSRSVTDFILPRKV
ncbi:hypothetical protein BDV25DRAFT_169599 [Aspergillus avenaceus]|uniref:F-box domain-containing protein n=1 Tax=Aspergillus avenaceus TaxID=36643 RepID=A0A5N6U3Q1_ASPAV|nr:hypothetical protein BDV25DRAFT_169599 [Aspergillus avenaceus]